MRRRKFRARTLRFETTALTSGAAAATTAVSVSVSATATAAAAAAAAATVQSSSQSASPAAAARSSRRSVAVDGRRRTMIAIAASVCACVRARTRSHRSARKRARKCALLCTAAAVVVAAVAHVNAHKRTRRTRNARRSLGAFVRVVRFCTHNARVRLPTTDGRKSAHVDERASERCAPLAHCALWRTKVCACVCAPKCRRALYKSAPLVCRSGGARSSDRRNQCGEDERLIPRHEPPLCPTTTGAPFAKLCADRCNVPEPPLLPLARSLALNAALERRASVVGGCCATQQLRRRAMRCAFVRVAVARQTYRCTEALSAQLLQ